MQVPVFSRHCALAAILYDSAFNSTSIMRPGSAAKRQSAARISWEQILANLDDGVIALDTQSKITFFNETSEMLTEISSATAVDQSFEKIFKREPWLIDLVRTTHAPPHKRAGAEGDLLSRWGRKLPIGVTVSPLRDRQGQFVGTILLLRDIKRRKELEEDLKRADGLALMGTLAAGLAHEIRNPLGGIKGAAQLLRRSAGGHPSVLDFTDIMIREVDRVNQLIEQLLDLSRPSRITLAAINIHEILEDVLLLETQALSHKTMHLRKRFDPSLPPVRGDRAQLTQVFLNLVKNAFQAMAAGGVLTVSTRLETDYHICEPGTAANRLIWVDLADNGHGIAEEHLAHIFSPFFTTKVNGTGLGLATCDRIIREHGGTIRVESIAGTGSTFKVSLVVAD